MKRRAKIENGTVLTEVMAHSKTSGKVYLPADWIGKEVRIILADSIAPTTTNATSNSILAETSATNTTPGARMPEVPRASTARSDQPRAPVCSNYNERGMNCNLLHRNAYCKGNLTKCEWACKALVCYDGKNFGCEQNEFKSIKEIDCAKCKRLEKAQSAK
ncbi:MAG: DUF2080 family transposase-associated protein [Candidatus Paceibacterota bacterium]|jgi:hypothetical protein